MIAALAACIAWQVAVFVTGRGGLDADESYMAVTGLDILHGCPRVFFPGQNYMGCVEAYIFALVRAVTGSSTPLTVRIQTALQTLVYLLTSWWLIRRFVGPRAALGGLAFLAVPPGFLARWYLRIRGYSPMMIWGNLILALLFEMRARPGRWGGVRGFFLLGLALGIAWWINPIALFHIVGAGLIVLFTPALRRAFFSGFAFSGGWPVAANLAAALAFAVLESRSVIAPRHSPLLRLMFEHRLPVLMGVGLLLAAALLPAIWRGTRARLIPALTAAGFLLGHGAALAVYWSKPFLNLKQSRGCPYLLVSNIVDGLPVALATLLGIGPTETGREMPDWAIVTVAAFYVAAFYIVARTLRRRGVPFVWMLILPAASYLILSAQNVTVWGMERYFLPFYVCAAAAMGVLFAELRRVAGRGAWLVFAVPLVVSAWGIAGLSRERIELPSGVPELEAKIAAYCLAQPLPAVFASNDDQAMRLTFFCDQKRVFLNAYGFFNRIRAYDTLFKAQSAYVVLCDRTWDYIDRVENMEPRARFGPYALFAPVPHAAVKDILPTYVEYPPWWRASQDAGRP